MSEQYGDSPGVHCLQRPEERGVQPACPGDFFLQWKTLLARLESQERPWTRLLLLVSKDAPPPDTSPHTPTPAFPVHIPPRLYCLGVTQWRGLSSLPHGRKHDLSLSLPSTPLPDPPAKQEPPGVPMTHVTGQGSDVEATEMSVRGVTTATQDSGLPWQPSRHNFILLDTGEQRLDPGS